MKPISKASPQHCAQTEPQPRITAGDALHACRGSLGCSQRSSEPTRRHAQLRALESGPCAPRSLQSLRPKKPPSSVTCLLPHEQEGMHNGSSKCLQEPAGPCRLSPECSLCSVLHFRQLPVLPAKLTRGGAASITGQHTSPARLLHSPHPLPNAQSTA